MNGPLAAGVPASTPAKIEAAMRYLQYCQTVNWGPHGLDGWKEGVGRELTSAEKRAYDAAITTITEYFNSPGFGDGSETSKHEPPDDPKERIPV